MTRRHSKIKNKIPREMMHIHKSHDEVWYEENRFNGDK